MSKKSYPIGDVGWRLPYEMEAFAYCTTNGEDLILQYLKALYTVNDALAELENNHAIDEAAILAAYKAAGYGNVLLVILLYGTEEYIKLPKITTKRAAEVVKEYKATIIKKVRDRPDPYLHGTKPDKDKLDVGFRVYKLIPLTEEAAKDEYDSTHPRETRARKKEEYKKLRAEYDKEVKEAKKRAIARERAENKKLCAEEKAVSAQKDQG